MSGIFICCASISGVTGECAVQSIWKCVSCIALLIFCMLLFFLYFFALVWWLTKMNQKLLWGTGAEIQCPPSLYGKFSGISPRNPVVRVKH